jgi:hypothetical protein
VLEEAIAESRLGETVAEFPGTHEVLVEVGELSELQRAAMLYNHAKQAALKGNYKDLIKRRAIEIIYHGNFTPERIRQLTEIILCPVGAERDITWADIQGFLNDPSDRWLKAYRQLNASEQVLLSAMLDFDGPTSLAALRGSYDSRSRELGRRRLTFEDSVSRLKHSFLTSSISYQGEELIALQHPSLRDMLLIDLREDASARIRYFQLASTFGLAQTMAALAPRDNEKSLAQHFVVPQTEEEFAVFLDRCQGFCNKVLSLKDWDELLSAAERLIPRRAAKPKPNPGSQSDRVARLKEMFAGLSSHQKVDVHELNLAEFVSTWPGRTMTAVLRSFAAEGTYGNARRLDCESWVRLLTRFYDLCVYSDPPVYPSFTSKLCGELRPESLDCLRLVNLIRRYEPLVIRQKVSPLLIQSLKETLASECTALIAQGADIAVLNDPDFYDTWKSETDQALKSALEFGRWNSLNGIDVISELDRLQDSIERPEADEADVEESCKVDYSGPYWTVERILEDL